MTTPPTDSLEAAARRAAATIAAHAIARNAHPTQVVDLVAAAAIACGMGGRFATELRDAAVLSWHTAPGDARALAAAIAPGFTLPTGPIGWPLDALFAAAAQAPQRPTPKELATLRRAGALAARETTLDARGAGPPGIGNAACEAVLEAGRRLSTPVRRLDVDEVANTCGKAAREAARGEPAIFAHSFHRHGERTLAQIGVGTEAVWPESQQSALEQAAARVFAAVDLCAVPCHIVAAPPPEETPTP